MHSLCTVQATCVPWLMGPEAQDESCAKNIHSSTRHVSLCTTPHSTLNTSTSSLPPTSPVLLSSSTPNPDLLSTHPFIHCTGYEPKRIELNRILVNPQNHFFDDQDDIEEIGVNPLSYSQSLIHSAYDSAQSNATPPDSDLQDEQLRKMLAQPPKIQEREENEGRRT